MVKYSNRGLVQFWNKKYSLFNLLYVTTYFTWSSGFYICLLVNSATFISGSEKGKNEQTERRRKTKIGVGFVFLLVFLILFLSVQYQKRKRPTVIKIQHNILTFDQSFYLYVLFFLCDCALMLLKEHSKGLEITLFISKSIFFHCLNPLFLIWNVKQSMPLLFSDSNPQRKVNNFYVSGLSIIPRRQYFLPLNKVSNAPWGSEVKYQTKNVNLSHNHMTPVDI